MPGQFDNIRGTVSFLEHRQVYALGDSLDVSVLLAKYFSEESESTYISNLTFLVNGEQTESRETTIYPTESSSLGNSNPYYGKLDLKFKKTIVKEFKNEITVIITYSDGYVQRDSYVVEAHLKDKSLLTFWNDLQVAAINNDNTPFKVIRVIKQEKIYDEFKNEHFDYYQLQMLSYANIINGITGVICPFFNDQNKIEQIVVINGSFSATEFNISDVIQELKENFEITKEEYLNREGKTLLTSNNFIFDIQTNRRFPHNNSYFEGVTTIITKSR